MSTYFIGDTHFYDKDIILFENRPFASTSQMNEYIIKQWNSVATNEDKVIVVGDFIDFKKCSEEQALDDVINRLKGQILLIAGNHDISNINFYKKLSREKLEVVEYPIIYNNFWIVSHEPMYVSANMPYGNIFAHVHNNPIYNTVSKRSYCVSAERLNYTPILDTKIFKAVRRENNG